jgi:hypothetical protein
MGCWSGDDGEGDTPRPDPPTKVIIHHTNASFGWSSKPFVISLNRFGG